MCSDSYKVFFSPAILMVYIASLVLAGCACCNTKDDDLFFADPALNSAMGISKEKAPQGKEEKAKAKAEAPVPDKTVWTLEDCVECAMKKNEKIKSIRAKRKAKDGEILEAWSDYLPTATFKYNRGNSNETGESSIYNISGKTLIWEGGKVKSQVKKMKSEKEMLKEEIRQEALSVIYEVKKHFYELLFRQYHVEAQRVGLESARANVRDVENRIKSEQAREVDMLGAKASVADSERELFEATNQYELTKKQLNYLMGRELNSELNPQGKLTFRQIPLRRSELGVKALSGNPQLKRLENAMEKTKFSKEAAHRRYFPNLYAVAFFEYRDTSKEYMIGPTGESEKLFQGRAYGIGAEVEIPLFRQIGIGYSQQKQAEQMMKSLEEDQKGAKREILYKIEEVCNKMEDSIHAINTAQMSIQYRDKMVEIVSRGMNEKIYQEKDLLEARKKQSDSQVFLMKSIMEYNIAQAQLDRLLGIVDTGIPNQ